MTGTIYGDVITTNLLPDAVRTVYSRELEMTARPQLVYDQPFFVETKKDFEEQKGDTVVWTVYHQIPASIAPLSQNQDIDGGEITDHQMSFKVQEQGYAIGTSEYLDLTSYHGPIGNIVKSLLAPQQALTVDTIARNTFWYAPNLVLTNPYSTGPSHLGYTGGVSTRYTMNQTNSVLTADTAKRAAYNLTTRKIPTIGEQTPCYVCLTHPSSIYDLRNDLLWKDAQFYAGATRIMNGEVGMIHGVRFITSDQARIANGGAISDTTVSPAFAGYQTYLTSSYKAGVQTVAVNSVTGIAIGDEITLHRTGIAATQTVSGSPVNWTAPDGRDATAEELIVAAINSGAKTLTFTNKLRLDHNSADFVTNCLDVYPMIFQGGLQALGKGTLVQPEIRVSLPTDKLRRIFYVGWYGLFGFGVLREHAYELVETCASINTPPPYGY